MASAYKECFRCKTFYVRPYKLSNSQWEQRRFCSKSCGAKKLDIRISLLKEMYLIDKKSSNQIAKEMGISGVHVLRILRGASTEIRPHSENKKLALNNPIVKEKCRLSSTGRKHSEESKNKLRALLGKKNANWRNGLTVTGGYLQFTASIANGEHAGRLLHDVIAEWLYERRLAKGEHVHHIDRNKLNNNPENLLIMMAGDHTRLHSEERKFLNG